MLIENTNIYKHLARNMSLMISRIYLHVDRCDWLSHIVMLVDQEKCRGRIFTSFVYIDRLVRASIYAFRSQRVKSHSMHFCHCIKAITLASFIFIKKKKMYRSQEEKTKMKGILGRFVCKIRKFHFFLNYIS